LQPSHLRSPEADTDAAKAAQRTTRKITRILNHDQNR
jgi:hypothetical protein